MGVAKLFKKNKKHAESKEGLVMWMINKQTVLSDEIHYQFLKSGDLQLTLCCENTHDCLLKTGSICLPRNS